MLRSARIGPNEDVDDSRQALSGAARGQRGVSTRPMLRDTSSSSFTRPLRTHLNRMRARAGAAHWPRRCADERRSVATAPARAPRCATSDYAFTTRRTSRACRHGVGAFVTMPRFDRLSAMISLVGRLRRRSPRPRALGAKSPEPGARLESRKAESASRHFGERARAPHVLTGRRQRPA